MIRSPLDQRIAYATHPTIAMPVGGIGTGGFAVAADGSWRQWQPRGIPNHEGAMPLTGLWLRASGVEPPWNELRLVQGTPVADPGAPLVTDGVVPTWISQAAARVGTFDRAEFSGTYPVSTVRLSDQRLPIEVEVTTWNPMVPLDTADSSIPVGLVEVTMTNTGRHTTHGTLAASLLNTVGWDGIVPLNGGGVGLGGNVNKLVRGPGWTRIEMDNPSLAEHDELAGQFVLAVDDDQATALPRCAGLDHLVSFLRSRAANSGRGRLAVARTVPDPQLNAPRSGLGPSPAGTTWAGVLGVPFELAPGESRTVRCVIAWHFANRFVEIEQFGAAQPQWGASRFWIGNHYAMRYPDAVAVLTDVATRWTELADATNRWTTVLADSDLGPQMAERMAAQASLIRSPTCFRGADGRFYGYEGSLGASTTMWSGAFGGSCPVNCTHVWQYEAALGVLWPELDLSMRDTEFDVMQAPEGYIPHRLRVPVYLPQMWNEVIGGPDEPALDGMLATILKALRAAQRGAGTPWLHRRWPALVRLVDYIDATWNTRADGILRGIQPSTHDIDLAGRNTFMGTLWLASLRAMQDMAGIVGDGPSCVRFRTLFERGSAAYDADLFDGVHYVQRLDDGDPVESQWLTGVLSDQLIGQWWAHRLALGYVLPVDHVRSALRHVVATNLRRGFDRFEHPYRVYADAVDDAGLLMCSWPSGGRPPVPTRYADEVWTGIEYQVAAHCLYERLDAQGEAVLDALWTRHDGRRRNPYNEIECGDHYARAMAGWSVLEARSGIRFDAVRGTLTVSADRPGRWPWWGSAGYGTVDVADSGVTVLVRGGTLEADVEVVDDVTGAGARVLGRVCLVQDGRAVVTRDGHT